MLGSADDDLAHLLVVQVFKEELSGKEEATGRSEAQRHIVAVFLVCAVIDCVLVVAAEARVQIPHIVALRKHAARGIAHRRKVDGEGLARLGGDQRICGRDIFGEIAEIHDLEAVFEACAPAARSAGQAVYVLPAA